MQFDGYTIEVFSERALDGGTKKYAVPATSSPCRCASHEARRSCLKEILSSTCWIDCVSQHLPHDSEYICGPPPTLP